MAAIAARLAMVGTGGGLVIGIASARSDAVAHELSALGIDPGNPAALAKALDADPALAQRIADRAMKARMAALVGVISGEVIGLVGEKIAPHVPELIREGAKMGASAGVEETIRRQNE